MRGSWTELPSIFPKIWKLRSCSMPGMPAATTPEKIPHPATAALDLATVMRTVGDPLRLEIVRLLADGRERSCNELQEALGLPASTGSYHLRLLRLAGVTRTRAAGHAAPHLAAPRRPRAPLPGPGGRADPLGARALQPLLRARRAAPSARPAASRRTARRTRGSGRSPAATPTASTLSSSARSASSIERPSVFSPPGVGHAADRRLVGLDRAVAAAEHPLEHARVLAEARATASARRSGPCGTS